MKKLFLLTFFSLGFLVSCNSFLTIEDFEAFKNENEEKEKSQDAEIETLKKRIEDIEIFISTVNDIEQLYSLLEKSTDIPFISQQLKELEKIHKDDIENLLTQFKEKENILNDRVKELENELKKLAEDLSSASINESDILSKIREISEKTSNIKNTATIESDESYLYYYDENHKLLKCEKLDNTEIISIFYGENNITCYYDYISWGTTTEREIITIDESFIIRRPEPDRNDRSYCIYCREYNTGFYTTKDKITYLNRNNPLQSLLQQDQFGTSTVITNEPLLTVLGTAFKNEKVYNSLKEFIEV